MKIKIVSILAGLSLLSSSAFATLDNLSNYDAAVEAQFSFQLSQTNTLPFVDTAPAVRAEQQEKLPERLQNLRVGSRTFLRNGEFPKTARVFFVFSAEGAFTINGKLVVAEPSTGMIYSQIADASSVSVDALANDFPSDFFGLLEESRGRMSLTTNMIFDFNLNGIQFTCLALVDVKSKQYGDAAFVSLRSGALVGDGGDMYALGKPAQDVQLAVPMSRGFPVIVTRGQISARGITTISPR